MKKALGFLLVSLLLGMMPSLGLANEVTVVPKGVFVLGLKFGYKFANRRFTDDFGSKTEDIQADYNIELKGEDLDPSLKGYTLGQLDVQYESFGMELTHTFGYGITDNLSVMMMVPFQRAVTRVKFNFGGGNIGIMTTNTGRPLAPIKPASESYPAADGAMLEKVITCTGPYEASHNMCSFQYKPLENFDRWGLHDIITAFRYRFVDLPYMQQGITVFNKWPTGKHDDTNNLFDVNFGDQQVDIGFWYGIDFTFPKEKFDPLLAGLKFNFTVGFTEQLPDTKEKRVVSRTFKANGAEQGQLPVAPAWQTMMINRDIGGNWDFFTGFTWQFVEWMSIGNEWYMFWKYPDNIWAAETIPDNPYTGETWYPDWRGMEINTDQAALETTVSLGFSSVPFVMKGQMPVPFNLSVGYTGGVAGKNFEQNHTFWCSLDLIGSIHMFEMLGGDGEAPPEDALPTRDMVQNEQVPPEYLPAGVNAMTNFQPFGMSDTFVRRGLLKKVR